MFRWLIFVGMSLLTVFTGGVVTWQLNDAKITEQDEKMISVVKDEIERSPMRYVVIKYGIEWKNDDLAIISGRTIYNIPVVTAQVDKNSIKGR